MSWFLVALGLILVIEGLVSAAFPVATIRAMLAAAQMPPQSLRITGVAQAVLGVGLVRLVRG